MNEYKTCGRCEMSKHTLEMGICRGHTGELLCYECETELAKAEYDRVALVTTQSKDGQ